MILSVDMIEKTTKYDEHFIYFFHGGCDQMLKRSERRIIQNGEVEKGSQGSFEKGGWF